MHIKIDQTTSAIEEVSASVISTLYNLANSTSDPLDNTSLLRGRVNATASYLSYIDNLHSKYPEFYITATKYYLYTGDPEFERICATNWGDGTGITVSDLEAVTGKSVYSVFKNNTNITDATAFKYFKNIYAQTGLENLAIFSGCTSLERCELPSHLKVSSPLTADVTNGWFYNCTSLNYVKIPDGFEIIGRNMFRNCSSLEYIDLSNTSVRELKPMCFCDSGLRHIDLPNTLTRIETGAFENSSIELITIPNSVTFMNGELFNQCSQLQLIIFEDGGTSPLVFSIANVWSQNLFASGNTTPLLTRVELPERVSDLGNHCFRNTSLRTIILKATTPPAIGSDGITLPNDAILYVPDASLSTYQSTTGYSNYASRIKGISELPS